MRTGKVGIKIAAAIGIFVFFFIMCFMKLISAFTPNGAVKTAGEYDVTQTAVYQNVKEATEDYYEELWEDMEEKKDEIMAANTTTISIGSTEEGTETVGEGETEKLCDVTVTVRMNYLGDAYLIAYLVYKEGMDINTAQISKEKAEEFLSAICSITTNQQEKEYEVMNTFFTLDEIAEKYFTTENEREEYKAACYAYSQFFDVSTAKVQLYEGNAVDSTTNTGIYSNTSLLDVPLYLQYDNAWAGVSYGNGTIKKNGCCPTCLAMVFSYLNQSVIHPDDVVAWCGNRYYVNGAGTSWAIFGNTYEKWNVKCTNIGKSQALMVQALQQRKPVIASMGPGTFTKGGHFIVLSGITSEGKIKVKDPNDSASKNHVNRDFEISLILRECKNMWVCE